MSVLRARTAAHLAFLFLAQAARAQSAEPFGDKLNGPLERDAAGGVIHAEITPDGAWIVYSATEDSQEPGLYSAPIDGSRDPVRIAPGQSFYYVPMFGPLGLLVVFSLDGTVYQVPWDGSREPAPLLRSEAGRTIAGVWVEPHCTRVVYSTYSDSSSGPFELFSIPLVGATVPVRLAGPLDLDWPRIGPDGLRLLIRSGSKLYALAIDGSSGLIDLDVGFSPGEELITLQFSPDGRRAVFLADRDTDEVSELYSVPLDASASPVKLNGTLVEGGDVREFGISPDGARVVYRANQENHRIQELYGVPIDGGVGAVKLNQRVFPAEDVYAFAVGPERVVYSLERSWKLFSSRLDGSTIGVELEGPAPSPAPIFRFARGGSRIVYYSNGQLYSVPAARGSAILLASGADWRWQVTRDGESVVYTQRLDEDELQLRRVVVEGGETLDLGAPVDCLSYAFDLQLGSDDHHALLRCDPDVRGVSEIFGVRLDGSSGLDRLNGALVTERIVADVLSMKASADGRRAAFTVSAYNEYDGNYSELYGVSLEPRSRPVKISGAAYAEYVPSTYLISPDGERIVFKSGDGESGYDLFTAPLDGSFAPVQLNDPGTSQSGVGTFRLSPDGALVLFYSYQGDGYSEIYATPIEGGAEIEVTGELPEEAWVQRFEPLPDERVLYLADARVPGQYELFRATIDGDGPPLLLVELGGGDVQPDFQVVTGAARVVYRADALADERFELFSVALDGTAPPVRLGSSPVDGGAVEDFRTSADGRLAVYRADQDADDVFELYAVPCDGSEPARRLLPALVAGGDVDADFELTPDGAQVVYRADALVDDRVELFQVRLDGSAAPVVLNGSLVAGGDVQFEPAHPYAPVSAPWAFRISPDGARVVYRADQLVDERFELFGVPLDGSAAPLALSGPLVASGDVLGGFGITPDSKCVVYAADQTADEVFELYAAPLDREKGARRLHRRPTPGGDAAFVNRYFGPADPALPIFEVTGDGERILYLADLDVDEVVELYLSSLAPRPGPQPRR